ncbi:hypothetical protein F8S13_11940 [Chloroflexia bacterium SDU3-3]|nr:hypothetical protein F8S13_11940 [Chloroflexia bacterium SDU3-3]
MQPRQHELRELLPGTLGGLALATRRGAAHLAGIGHVGGLHTAQRYGAAYMRELGRKGAHERWRRARQPRTVEEHATGQLIAVYRRVCYRRPRSRARRPQPVFILLWEPEQD